jgi:hypothetical protein
MASEKYGKFVYFKVKVKDFWRFVGYEGYLHRKLSGKDKTAFKKLMSYLVYEDYEPDYKTRTTAQEKTDNIVSYFGISKRHNINHLYKPIALCVLNYMEYLATKKPLKKGKAIIYFYTFLKKQTKESHYRLAAISAAIAYEFGFVTESQKKFPLEKGKSSANELFKIGNESIPDKLKKPE